jgi:hypothetical protein
MDGSNFSAAVAAKTQWTATLTNFGIHLFVRLLCKRPSWRPMTGRHGTFQQL